MDLTKILSISGKPGLFKTLSQTKTGAIVESLLDGKRFPVFAHEKISSLEEISIFTETDDIPLKDVLKIISEKTEGEATPDFKGNANEIAAFFEEILPDYDKDRVYKSDMKKVISWYNLLLEKDLLDFTEEEEAEDEKKAEEKEVKDEKKEIDKEDTKEEKAE